MNPGHRSPEISCGYIAQAFLHAGPDARPIFRKHEKSW